MIEQKMRETNELEISLNGAIAINNQYIKDLSFESPKTPYIFTEKSLTPKVNVSIDINATKLQKDVFEVELRVNANAQKDETAVFLIELVYAGIFTIKGVEESLTEEILLIQCPSLIFPFARRIIYDTTRDAGFPPLMLNPIDFGEMYRQKKEGAKKEK
jgi:preprotein translocase subunit SecB